MKMTKLQQLNELVGIEMTVLELTNKIEVLGTTECLRGTTVEEALKEESFGVVWGEDEFIFFFDAKGEYNGWETMVVLTGVM